MLVVDNVILLLVFFNVRNIIYIYVFNIYVCKYVFMNVYGERFVVVFFIIDKIWLIFFYVFKNFWKEINNKLGYFLGYWRDLKINFF